MDEFPQYGLRKNRSLFLAIFCFVDFLLGLLCVTEVKKHFRKLKVISYRYNSALLGLYESFCDLLEHFGSANKKREIFYHGKGGPQILSQRIHCIMILKTYMISERPYKNMDKPTEVLVMEEPPPPHTHTHTHTHLPAHHQ